MKHLREAPQMFLGNGNQNFSALQAFLYGYNFGNLHNTEYRRFILWFADTAMRSNRARTFDGVYVVGTDRTSQAKVTKNKKAR